MERREKGRERQVWNDEDEKDGVVDTTTANAAFSSFNPRRGRPTTLLFSLSPFFRVCLDCSFETRYN